MKEFLIKCDDVIGDTIDDESIVLNVSNGIYYALRNLGSKIWVLLESGISREEIHELMDSDGEHAALVDSFVEELKKESLIKKKEGDYQRNIKREEIIHDKDYRSVKLEKYTDMKDLLDLDPVHEVYHHSKKKSK